MISKINNTTEHDSNLVKMKCFTDSVMLNILNISLKKIYA